MNTNIETKNAPTPVTARRRRDVVAPRCDIYENDRTVHVVAEMPGVDAKTVEVTVERNVLTIKGTADTNDPEGFRLLWREFDGVDYRRSFELSSEADSSSIKASMQNGLLRVEVPKSVPTQRRIPIQTA
ncbi:MAG: Hsp20/alpha crystallin family protein [Planctomycetes bacterium]|nr:Hsp20/alpha crystallin family protein [Planctomycetota bacterium]